MVTSSFYWQAFMSMNERLSLQKISKSSSDEMVKSVPHLFQNIVVTKSNLNYRNRDVVDADLIRLWSCCGDQIRSVDLRGLTQITGECLVFLREQPHLTTISVSDCCNMNGAVMVDHLYLHVTLPKLRNVVLADTSMTKDDLLNLEDRGVTHFDVFACDACLKVSLKQAQCKGPNCQPSTVALCVGCAVDADMTVCSSCEITSCDNCLSSTCHENIQWKRCGRTGCKIASCEFDGCKDIGHCDGCNTDLCKEHGDDDYAEGVKECTQCSGTFCADCCFDTVDFGTYCNDCRDDAEEDARMGGYVPEEEYDYSQCVCTGFCNCH